MGTVGTAVMRLITAARWLPQSIVDGLGGVLLRFPFRVPAYYALILRSLTVLEGLALQADARYKLLGKAYPYMARRLLTDPAPELRRAPLLPSSPTGCRVALPACQHALRHAPPAECVMADAACPVWPGPTVW